MALEEKGLTLVSDFITEEEEKELLDNIGTSPINEEQKKRNSVKRYGSKLPYSTFMVSDTIPDYLKKICEKLYSTGKLDTVPNSVTVNEYYRGQSIPYHVDSLPSGRIISIISLLSDTEMSFKQKDTEIKVVIPRRSLVQMNNEVRYRWKHGVFDIPDYRISLVFRNAKYHTI